MRRSRQTGLKFWWDVAATATEMGAVVPLRLMRIAQGGAKGHAETQRMMSEKALAFFEAQIAIATALSLGQGAAAAHRAFAPYKRRVRANRRRLTPKF